MSQGVVQLSLQRNAPGPWGLRLQGGMDFEKSLVISHVVDGSPSNVSGLMSGDVLLEINGQNAMTMTHKQAQEAIISAGDNVPLLVQRSGSLSAGPPAWRPKVEVVDGLPRTSLAANKTEEDTHWDVRHNITAKGFQPPSSSDTPGFRSVSAPITKPGHVPSGPPKIALCWMCSQQVTGLFVIVKGQATCTKCFKCSQCSGELKNVGHVQLGDKLICTKCHQEGEGQAPKPSQGQFGASQMAMPKGLAANLTRLASDKQQNPSKATPPNPTSTGSSPNRMVSHEWSQRLDADQAGMAMNAEDFTKQFMKQLTGGQ